MIEIEIVSKYFTHSSKKHKNRIMIDVGAHVGSSALPFAKNGWEVYCFEPEKSNYEELEENLKDYPKTHLIKMGVSDKNEDNVPFYVSDEHWGIHTLKPFHSSHKKSETISTTRLDTIISENKIDNIDFLKIDVEGADFLVLKGVDWEKIHPEIVIAEFMDTRTVSAHGYSFHDMVGYMANRGYSCFVSEYGPIIEYGRKNRVTKSSEFKGVHEYHKESSPEWGNLLFCDKSKKVSFEKIIQKTQFGRKIKQTLGKLYIFK